MNKSHEYNYATVKTQQITGVHMLAELELSMLL